MSDEIDLMAELDNLPEELTTVTIPEVGKYLFEVVTAEYQVSKNGVPNINMRLRFVDGKYQNQSLFYTLYYSKKSDAGISMFWRQIKAIGVSHEWIRENRATLEDAAKHVVGARFEGRLTHREFNGENTANIFAQKFVDFNEDARVGLDSSSGDTVVGGSTLDDDDDDGAPAAPAAAPAEAEAEKVPVAVGAVTGVITPEDDPW